MKIIFASALTVISTVAFASFPAHAMIQAPGTFIPHECGTAEAVPNATVADPVREICFGQVVGQKDGQPGAAAVSFQLTDGSIKKFDLVRTANLMLAYSNNESESILSLRSDDGQGISMRTIRDANGKLESVSGVIAGAPYFADSFQPMVVIQ